MKNLIMKLSATFTVIAFFMFGESLTVIDMASILLAGVAVWLVMTKSPVVKSARAYHGDIYRPDTVTF